MKTMKLMWIHIEYSCGSLIICSHSKCLLITSLCFYMAIFRSSRSQMFFQKGVLKEFCNIHRKTPVFESLFNQVAPAADLIKLRLQLRLSSAVKL